MLVVELTEEAPGLGQSLRETSAAAEPVTYRPWYSASLNLECLSGGERSPPCEEPQEEPSEVRFVETFPKALDY